MKSAMKKDAPWRGMSRLAPVAIFIAGVVVLASLYRGEVAFFFHAPKPFVRKIGVFFSSDAERLRKLGHIVEGDWIFKKGALSLPPKGKGRLVIRLSKKEKAKPVFRLHTAALKSSAASLYVRFNGGERKTIPLNGKVFVFRGRAGRHIGRVEIEARTPGVSHPVVLLKGVEVFFFSEDARRLFPFPSLLVILLTPFIFYYGFGVGEKRFYIALLALIIASLPPRVLPFMARWMPLLFYVAVGVILIHTAFKRRLAERANQISLIMIFAFVVMGFSLRWSPLIENAGQLLDPDAIGYMTIAREGCGLFNTACGIAPYIREPLFIWFIKAAFLFAPAEDATLRLLTVLLSLLVIPATYYAGRRMFGRAAGLGAAFACAVNPYFIFMSTRGLRMELYILCVLAFLVSLDFLQGKQRWGGIWVGIAAGICALARLTSLSFTIPLTLYFGLRRKSHPVAVVTALIVPFIFIAPHFYFNYRQTEDALFSSNIHARFYRNREFAGKPGFPSVEEVHNDPYCGEPITTAGYIFGLHTFPQVVKITMRGLYLIFLRGYVTGGLFGGSRIIFLFYLFGLCITLFSRRWEWVLVAVVLEAPSAFLAGMHLDWRLALHTAPLIYLFLMNGLIFIASKRQIIVAVIIRHLHHP